MTAEAELPAALRITPDDDVRRERLVRMQRTATFMLVVVALLFLATRAFEHRHPWLGYLRAFCEAAMVGGIADWFAVTALFRRPLGLPIPHTAIVPSRKDRIGTALGTFVQRNFLAREVVANKLAAMRPGARAAAWLVRPGNSRRLARAIATGVAGAAHVLRDEEVQVLVDRGVLARLRRQPVAPLVARLIERLTAGGRHQALLDEAVRLAARFLDENEATVREKIRQGSPWWIPGSVENRLGDRIVAGVEQTLMAVAGDPHHPLRARYDEAIERFVSTLRDDPAMIARAEQVKLELLAHPDVAAWSREFWGETKARLAAYATRLGADPSADESPAALEQWLAGVGERVLADPALADTVDGWIIEAITVAVEQAREEVAALIATTVATWDADATARKIELQIGRDLQFIRINGTLVGGLVGLALYVAGRLFP